MNKPIVDGNFARLGGKSYALDKINSLEIKSVKLHPGAILLAVMLALIAVPMTLAAFAVPVMFILSLACWVGAVFAYKSRKVFEHTLILTTSSRDVAALKSRDFDSVDALRKQIETAMSSNARP